MPGSVDGLLDGGLREGHLTELYGEPASGKTQVLQIAVRVITYWSW